MTEHELPADEVEVDTPATEGEEAAEPEEGPVSEDSVGAGPAESEGEDG